MADYKLGSSEYIKSERAEKKGAKMEDPGLQSIDDVLETEHETLEQRFLELQRDFVALKEKQAAEAPVDSVRPSTDIFASDDDARRELEKLRDVLKAVYKQLYHAGAANAALHMNETVRPSPLAAAVETNIEKINELLGGDE